MTGDGTPDQCSEVVQRTRSLEVWLVGLAHMLKVKLIIFSIRKEFPRRSDWQGLWGFFTFLCSLGSGSLLGSPGQVSPYQSGASDIGAPRSLLFSARAQPGLLWAGILQSHCGCWGSHVGWWPVPSLCLQCCKDSPCTRGIEESGGYVSKRTVYCFASLCFPPAE